MSDIRYISHLYMKHKKTKNIYVEYLTLSLQIHKKSMNTEPIKKDIERKKYTKTALVGCFL